MIILCNNYQKINDLEIVFTNENYLNILLELYEKKELMKIVDIQDMFITLISSLIKTVDHYRIANYLKKIGIIDHIIKIFEENKIHTKILSRIMDIVLYIKKNKFKILNKEQVIRNLNQIN